MATIDLYHCTVDELTRHVSSPRISISTLERYVKETLKLIQRQKEEDKAEHGMLYVVVLQFVGNLRMQKCCILTVYAESSNARTATLQTAK